MKKLIIFTLSMLLSCTSIATENDSTRSNFLDKITPHSVNLQFAGNNGMFSTGVRYQSHNEKWQIGLSYGFVPKKYADHPIHSITVKGYYVPFKKEVNDNTEIDLLKIGMWYNRSLGDEYFFKLPKYYDRGYYYFPTAGNIGLTLGSEIKHQKWGFYYDIGTTEKILINYVKSPKSINFHELWNLSLGLVYHIK